MSLIAQKTGTCLLYGIGFVILLFLTVRTTAEDPGFLRSFDLPIPYEWLSAEATLLNAAGTNYFRELLELLYRYRKMSDACGKLPTENVKVWNLESGFGYFGIAMLTIPALMLYRVSLFPAALIFVGAMLLFKLAVMLTSRWCSGDLEPKIYYGRMDRTFDSLSETPEEAVRQLETELARTELPVTGRTEWRQKLLRWSKSHDRLSTVLYVSYVLYAFFALNDRL